MMLAASAQAHLMPAQRGTLNIVRDAAFLVLSVPVSGLQGIDDDGDGALSRAELQRHADAVRAQLRAGVQLMSANGPLPLQLVMVDVAAADNAPEAPASQLSVLGRFALPVAMQATADPQVASSDALSLRFAVFGARAGERLQHLTVTRGQETQWLRFTPEQTTHALLPGLVSVLGSHVVAGALHVLAGADHLLFLLVVLLGSWRWRGLLGALTCFTAGHALTLAACVLGGWSLPASIVEPAIAATLVGTVGFDVWARRRATSVSTWLRLALVFACALIHGLGLVAGLAELTQWPAGSRPMLLALVGFNAGIELVQIGVAATAGLMWWGLQLRAGASVQRRAGQFATRLVFVAWSGWLAERLFLAG